MNSVLMTLNVASATALSYGVPFSLNERSIPNVSSAWSTRSLYLYETFRVDLDCISPMQRHIELTQHSYKTAP